MKLDIITIFPDYFQPLSLSLVGKAIESGILNVAVHDLRDWTHDRHRTVDDTPYGGGAGMVMKPEPWGAAFDTVLGAGDDAPAVIIPSPSGTPFTQDCAAELAQRSRLVFACGRYEGIDQRVFDWVGANHDLYEVSLGDYVLNGGEVAALAIIEAVVRLIPGVLGNPDSIVEESYTAATGGLLEYPGYTKPASWRGLDVPEVLLSGDHGAVDRWRAAQSLQRTRLRRPDLLDTEVPAAPEPTE